MRAQYEPLSKLVGLPRNPKAHNLGDIHQSIDRFGFVSRIVINDVTNHILAGNGRVDTLRQKKLSGQSPPEGVEDRGDDWYVPTDRVSIPEKQEEALAVALNKIGENEWDDKMTASVLSDLAAKDDLQGTGFDGEELDFLLKKITPRKDLGNVGDEILSKYREEKENWRWVRVKVTADTYDRWHNARNNMKTLENDDDFVDFLLNLLTDELIEAL